MHTTLVCAVAVALFACRLAAASSEEPPPLYLALDPESEWTTVFNHTAEACTEHDTTDSMSIAWFSPQHNLTTMIAAASDGVFPNVGPTLDELKHDCSRIVFNSTFNTSPASFANYQWLQSVHDAGDEDGTLWALIHNEFHGWEVPANASLCNITGRARLGLCNLWSTGLGVSRDGGLSFELAAAPPAHRVASAPYQYEFDMPVTGYGAVSAFMSGKDGASYGLIHAMAPSGLAQATGHCPVRSPSPTDPASFRAWDGSSFSVTFVNPYTSRGSGSSSSHIDKAASTPGICTVLNGTSGHPSPRRIHWLGSEYGPLSSASSPPYAPSGLPNYVMLGDGIDSKGIIGYRFSYEEDFADAVTNWTEPQLYDLGLSRYLGKSGIIYPTILDHNSPGLGSNTFAYVSNASGYIYINVERDILRHRFFFTTTPPPPPPTPPPPAPTPDNCSSFNVTEAGMASVNGVYTASGRVSDGVPAFVNSNGEQLYRFEGAWRLGQPDVAVWYEPADDGGARPSPQDWRVVGGAPPAPLYVACIQ